MNHDLIIHSRNLSNYSRMCSTLVVVVHRTSTSPSSSSVRAHQCGGNLQRASDHSDLDRFYHVQ